MASTLEYRDFDIFPSPRPFYDHVKVHIQFQPVARVMRRGGVKSVRVEVDPSEGRHFETPEAASDFIVERVKAMIDRAEVEL